MRSAACFVPDGLFKKGRHIKPAQVLDDPMLAKQLCRETRERMLVALAATLAALAVHPEGPEMPDRVTTIPRPCAGDGAQLRADP
jgi:hypothetical protein